MAVDRDGRTDLHDATLEGREADVRTALVAGQDPNAKDARGWSPLHFAAQSQERAVAVLLVASGADVDACDMFGKTPLGVALFNVMDGDGIVVRLLLDSGADPDLQNNSGISPRMLADTPSIPLPGVNVGCSWARWLRSQNYDLKRFFEPT